jgi:hypothetical protein
MSQIRIVCQINRWAALTAMCLLAGAAPAMAEMFTTSYLDGSTWSTIYTQGFTPGLDPSPVPAPEPTTVYLKKFEFFESGNEDDATDIRLAIFDTMYPYVPDMSTTGPNFVGLSTNTVPNTDGTTVGAPITFNFDYLPLSYYGNYSAVLVNESAGVLTPVLVQALTANYSDVGGGDYHPETNYGWDPVESDYNHVTSNYINAGYFSAFSYAGDADFRATLATEVPEPAALGLAMLGMITWFSVGRRSRHSQ